MPKRKLGRTSKKVIWANTRDKATCNFISTLNSKADKELLDTLASAFDHGWGTAHNSTRKEFQLKLENKNKEIKDCWLCVKLSMLFNIMLLLILWCLI